MNCVLKALVMTAKSNRKQEYHIMLWTVYWKPRSWQLNQTGSKVSIKSIRICYELCIESPSHDSLIKQEARYQSKVSEYVMNYVLKAPVMTA